jgi:intein/homing endonuclease
MEINMFTASDIPKIIKLYESGKSQQIIAELFLCNQKTISNILRRNGVISRNDGNKKYYDINTSLFKTINTEAGAYFLGLLYADGNVQIKNSAYCVSLKLKSNDQCIIEKFRDIMSPSSSVKITRNKNSANTYSYFRVNQKEVCEQLISHGCMPNKSLILKFPTTVPNELIHHFLRGYSDGDGTIYKNKFKNKKTVNTIWKIVSTKQFCEQVAKILKEQLDINCSQSLSRPQTNKITTVLSVGGNLQSRKVLDWLYQDATIYLPRKHEKYLEFIKS